MRIIRKPAASTVVLAGLTLFGETQLHAQTLTAQLADLSIEELTMMSVTSASRRPEPLSTAASAIFVITPDDIRRSGATSIPEALRLAPGLHVARIDSRRWAISARGFNGEFANKLLVLIDGRSIYTPVHGGVNWDAQDLFLQDIERIEVIRGPGAAQWGANAVNGVINIISKSAHDTHGGLATAAVGTELNTTAVRWGDTLGETGSYRVHAKYLNRDESPTPTGDADDEWWQGRAGFRSDWTPQARDKLTLQGAYYQGEVGRLFPVVSSLSPPYNQPLVIENRMRGGNLLGRWIRTHAPGNEWTLQTYVDWYEARPLQVEEKVFTFDVDFQHRIQIERHQIVWGGGYRYISDSFASSFTIAFEPNERTAEVFSAFVQDTIELTDTTSLTLGAKLEHNDYTEFELQPSIQFTWSPSGRHTVWSSISRAVHTPSRADSDFRAQVLAPGGNVLTRFSGNNELEPEELIAYEMGYRVSPVTGLFIDLALFNHEYDRLLGTKLGTFYQDSAGRLVVPAAFANGVEGRAWGAELAARWQVVPAWRLDFALSSLEMDLNASPALAAGSDASENSAPQHQLSVFSRFDINESWSLDGFWRHVDNLEASGVSSFTELDLRVAFMPRPEWTFSLVGQNLLDSQHSEFRDIGAEIERAVYFRVSHQF